MARPFFETLRELRGGLTLEELGEALTNVVAGVTATGKTGELVLRIKIKAPKRGGATYLHVEDEVTSKVPKLDRADTIFFPTATNDLSRFDQRQRQLPLSSVDRETGEVITHEGAVADGR